MLSIKTQHENLIVNSNKKFITFVDFRGEKCKIPSKENIYWIWDRAEFWWINL